MAACLNSLRLSSDLERCFTHKQEHGGNYHLELLILIFCHLSVTSYPLKAYDLKMSEVKLRSETILGGSEKKWSYFSYKFNIV